VTVPSGRPTRTCAWTRSRGGGFRRGGIDPRGRVGQTVAAFFGTDDPAFPPLAAHRRALGGEPSEYPPHRDLWASNLLAAPDSGPDGEIAIIDWSQAGVGVLGEDPANLVFDSAWMYGLPSDALPTTIPLVLDAYCAGLREAG